MQGDKVIEIGRLMALQNFEGEGGNFEGDAMFDWQPVKFFQSRRDVIKTFDKWEDDTSKGILDSLKTVD